MSLLHKIERYLEESGVPRTRFGRIAVNDPRLVDDMRRGREPRPETIARIESLISGGRS